MLLKSLHSWWILPLLMVFPCAHGQTLDQPQASDGSDQGTLSLYFENDLFTETDQNYTNGIRLSLVSPDLDSFQQRFIDNDALQVVFDQLNPRLNAFHDWLFDLQDYGETRSRRIVLSFGQMIYTPETIDARQLLADERPYAGWLYMGVAYHLRTKDSHALDQLETLGVNLGIVGPWALGQEAQDLIHDVRGFDKFQGWGNQLKNEPGFQLIYENKRKLLKQHNGNGFEYDVIGHYGASLGNIAVYANGGAEFRAGWNIPDDFGTSAVRPGGDNSAPDTPGIPDWGFHLFVSTDARLVAHDIFLDGNTFSNSHSVSKEYLVADAAIGFSLSFDELKLSFARIHRTKEFKKQQGAHNYGSLSLSWNFNL
ncbi:MAG: lipid A deacylase LpxR family protein [Motiliproteus sp.]